MTTNAIAFQNYQEARRHNLEMELATKKSNQIAESQAVTAAKNAATNERNAATNERNTAINAYDAESRRTSATASSTQAAAAWRQASNTEFYNTGWLEETRRHNQAEEENEALKATAQVIGTSLGAMAQVAGWFGLGL